MRKAVYCSNSKCHCLYHQDVDPRYAITVAACPRCSSPGVMIVNPSSRLIEAPRPNAPETALKECALIEKVLAGDERSRVVLHNAYVAQGYALFGFHGCGTIGAASMMRTGLDPGKSVVGVRGPGFYVGSRFAGLPSSWAGKASAKGQGEPTILGVYIKGFGTMVCGVDYDWGMMDGTDDIDDEGQEIAIFPHAYCRLRVLPCLATPTPDVWASCPQDNIGFEERRTLGPVVERAAMQLNMTTIALFRKISQEKLSKVEIQLLEKIAKELGVKL